MIHPTYRPLARLPALLLSLVCTLPGLALAHGTQTHHAANEPVRLEQQSWGIAAEAKQAKRTLNVSMGDNMRFSPDLLNVKQGETVRLKIHNTGKVLHEFVLGTPDTLAEHAALMLKFPNMQHDEPYMAHVPPGQTGEIVWTFNRPGDVDFACLIAGHYQAGMVGKISVTP
jgi:uncharacterized cupredoxin-like copper-binding protein